MSKDSSGIKSSASVWGVALVISYDVKHTPIEIQPSGENWSSVQVLSFTAMKPREHKSRQFSTACLTSIDIDHAVEEEKRKFRLI